MRSTPGGAGPFIGHLACEAAGPLGPGHAVHLASSVTQREVRLRVDRGHWIGVRSPEFRAISERIKVATRHCSRLSQFNWDEPAAVRECFEELTGRPVGDSFHLIPPFYADYGLNITVGRAVFIGYECMFTGHGSIDIEDEVMIANRVNLVTAGHPVEPELRRAYITVAPIKVERNAWIGTAATVLPGVTVGMDSVVAAGAVVTHDVPPATLVAGVPATVIRHL